MVGLREGCALAACRVCCERARVPTACQGGAERPCSGNGYCSGDGSRQGDGSCQCHIGYRGALCTDCVDGYFSSLRNETHSVCTGTAGSTGPVGLSPALGRLPRVTAGGTTDGLRTVSLPVPEQAQGRQCRCLLTSFWPRPPRAGSFAVSTPVSVLCGLAPAVAWLRLALPQRLSWQAGQPSSALPAVPGCGAGTEAKCACCHSGLVSGSEQRLCRGQAHVAAGRRDGEVAQTDLEQLEATRCALLAPGSLCSTRIWVLWCLVRWVPPGLQRCPGSPGSPRREFWDSCRVSQGDPQLWSATLTVTLPWAGASV